MGEERLPVDRGWAWMIVVGYFFSVFCMVGIAKSFGILLQEFVTYFDIPLALGALIMGVCGGVYTVTAPICVTGGQHITQRVVVVLGGIIGGVGLCLSCLLFSIEYVIVMFGVFFGIGNACLFGNGLVMIGQYFSKRRSLANGLSLAGASVGQFALPPLLQYLLDNFYLKGTLLLLGAIYLNVIACGLLYRPPAFYTQRRNKSEDITENEKLLEENNGPVQGTAATFQTSESVPQKELNDLQESQSRLLGETLDQSGRNNSASTGRRNRLHRAVVKSENEMEASNTQSSSMPTKFGVFCKNLLDFSVLKNYVVILFVLVSFLAFFGHFNFILFMPLSAFSKGVSKYEKALLVSITGACDLCGRVLIGFIGDMNFVTRYKLYAISVLITGINIFIFAFADTFWWMGIHVGLYGFFGGCYVSINGPVLIDLVGLKQMPKVLGVVLFIQGLGAALGQPALGAIKDHLGSYTVVNIIESATLVISSVLLFLYPAVQKLQDRNSTEPVTREQTMELTI